jgi:hypothetical protein
MLNFLSKMRSTRLRACENSNILPGLYFRTTRYKGKDGREEDSRILPRDSFKKVSAYGIGCSEKLNEAWKRRGRVARERRKVWTDGRYTRNKLLVFGAAALLPLPKFFCANRYCQ